MRRIFFGKISDPRNQIWFDVSVNAGGSHTQNASPTFHVPFDNAQNPVDTVDSCVALCSANSEARNDPDVPGSPGTVSYTSVRTMVLPKMSFPAAAGDWFEDEFNDADPSPATVMMSARDA